MSPTEGEGGHIVFGADPVWRRRQRQRQRRRGTFLFARYLMNRWVDFN